MIDVRGKLQLVSMTDSYVSRMLSCLVRDFPRHVSLRSLERPERLAEIELNVISFTFHAYTQEDSSLRVEV